MQFGFVAAGEEPSRFEHDIDVQFFPRQVGRIAVLQDLNFVTAHDDVLVIVTDLAVEFAVHRIPFEQMSQSMRVREIIDGEDLLDLFLRHGAKDVASDAPETVDCVVGHKGKLKVEGLNRYAENLKRPTPKASGVESWTLSVQRFVVRTCITLLGVTWLILSGESVDASPTKTILVLGDSLSQGFGLAPSEAYPMLLAKKLRATGLNFQVTNASAAGGTTQGGLERLPAHLKRKIDIFIVELGINDAFRGVPVDQIQNNLQQIIDKAKTRNPGVRVVIAGMQLPNYAADDYVSAFGKMFVDLAAKNGAALVPYLLQSVAGDPSLNLSDGIHPNAAGQKVLAETVWQVLEPVARDAYRNIIPTASGGPHR
jgi:acyl-CoA thioesterase I